MKYQPFVSVVMPNYNGARFVEKAIRCVQEQTYPHFELIIVDDCSTDHSPELIEAMAAKDPRIRLIRSPENHGVAVTRNMGIAEAKGDYIALFDNDDLWEKSKLARQVALAGKGADIAYCSYDFVDENDASIKKPFVVPAKTNFRKMLVSSVISCSTAFIRADLLKAHPFNPEYYHEDYVLWMELLKLPKIKALGDPKVLMHYRQVSGSRSNKKGNAAKERWHIYREFLDMNLFSSALAFAGYAIKGVMKYYL